MNVRPFAIAGGLIAAAALIAVALRPEERGHRDTWEAMRVERRDAVESLHENGTLVPREPQVVSVPFDGRLQWVIEDSTWVQAGAPLYVIDDQDELKRAADDRTALGEARQDRELAALRRSQAADGEDRRVRKAKQDLVIEEARHRINVSPAVGGMELVRLDEELAPLARRSAAARSDFDAARRTWQGTQDAFLDKLDAWEDHQDKLLRAQSRVEELLQQLRDAEEPQAATVPGRTLPQGVPTTGKNAEKSGKKTRKGKRLMDQPVAATAAGMMPAPATAPAIPVADPEVLRKDLAKAQEDLAGLLSRSQEVREAMEAAQQARDAAQGPRDKAAAALETAEAAERELRIRIEIEKRDLPATNLAIDLKVADIALAEAERRLAEGRAAAASGALSQVTVEDLQANRDGAATQRTIISQRLALARRPIAAEVIAEADARLAKAQAAAANAEAIRTRNLAILDQDLAVADAKIDRLSAMVAARSRRFASTIEAEIAAKRRDLVLRPDQKEQLTRELAQLQQDLAAAIANPPNVLTAPVAGLVRVRRDGDRQRSAGDQVTQADPLVEIYPPTGMDVVVRVNEVNVARLTAGLPVVATIPALDNLVRRGRIARISGIGRDKNDGGDRRRAAGVTQFDVRVTLEPGSDGRDAEYRQGMTVQVDIEQERRPAVLMVSRAAVVRHGDGWAVFRRPEGPPVAVQGRPFGDTGFMIDSGLAEGDEVHVLRRSDP